MNSTAPPAPQAPSPLAMTAQLDPSTAETCDRCGPGTPAQVSVIVPGGLELTLCGHHARKSGFLALYT